VAGVAAQDLVLIAIPSHAYRGLPAEPFAGTIVVNAMNYYLGRDGHVSELDSDRVTSSELFARQLPGTRIVKAFNTMYWETPVCAADITPQQAAVVLTEG
jgi:predicted dinucleotide-binding enzyme